MESKGETNFALKLNFPKTYPKLLEINSKQ